MIKFNMDEYSVEVLRTADQYNDYSVAYDVVLRITDLDRSWTQMIKTNGDDLESIRRGFHFYNCQGWIRPTESKL